MNHPLLIGAGGVASYLLPVLLKTFDPEKLTIIDKDMLEKRNLDRQHFDLDQVGQNKALALAEKNRCSSYTTILNDWFSDSTIIPEDIDCIICMADNHEARFAAINRAKALRIRAFIGGNEFLDSQAFVYEDWMEGTPKDPLVRYPLIATSHEGSPFRCTGEAQEIFPQLAIANLACAAKLLHLLWIHERWLPENRAQLTPESIRLLPVELFTSLTENSLL